MATKENTSTALATADEALEEASNSFEHLQGILEAIFDSADNDLPQFRAMIQRLAGAGVWIAKAAVDLASDKRSMIRDDIEEIGGAV